MKYTPHKIIKLRARSLARAQGIQLSKALENEARKHGFAHNFEMAKVAKRNGSDPRLIRGAFGVADLADAIDERRLTDYLQDYADADDWLLSEVAQTNAYAFAVDAVQMNGANYDANRGELELNVSFNYGGDQDSDRPWHGNVFYITEAKLRFFWRRETWEPAFDAGFEMIRFETDRDRDFEQQQLDV